MDDDANQARQEALELIEGIQNQLEAVSDFVFGIAFSQEQLYTIFDAVERSQTTLAAILNLAPPPPPDNADSDSDVTG